MNIENLINFKKGVKMDYILLVLIIILFFNKQNRDRLIRHNYREKSYNKDRINNIIGSKYEESSKNEVIRTKKNNEKKYNLNNLNNTIKTRINNYEEYYEADNNIKNNDSENNIVNELNKNEINENIDSKKQYKVLDICEDNYEFKESQELYKENVINNEIVDNIDKVITYSEDEEIYKEERKKESDSGYNKESSYNGYDESEKYEKEYIDLNDNQQYRVVDICENNHELKASQELYKENIINNINNEIVDNIDKVITYSEDKEIYKEEGKKDNHFEKSENSFNELKKRYMGVNVSVLISGVGIIEGEIVFDFPNIIAVKNKEDIIIFIDEAKILGIY